MPGGWLFWPKLCATNHDVTSGLLHDECHQAANGRESDKILAYLMMSSLGSSLAGGPID